MLSTPSTPDDILSVALVAAQKDEVAMRAALDELPTPIYTTDADGRITYYNRACIGFAGRTPEVGRDSWCVTWKLFTEDGEFLPHERCPMAVAVKEKRQVRGVGAIAERPDGSRVSFIPYPTPLLGETGEVVGAVNLLIDVTAQKQAAELRAQAQRCQRLANGVNDPRTIETLKLMAADYEAKARELQRPN